MYEIVYSHSDREPDTKKTINKAKQKAERINEPAAIRSPMGYIVAIYFGADVGWITIH